MTLRTGRPLRRVHEIRVSDAIIHGCATIGTEHIEEIEVSESLGRTFDGAPWTSDHIKSAKVSEFAITRWTPYIRSRSRGEPSCSAIERAACIWYR